MEKLIAIEDLIKEAQKLGIDFGKGNPYNRLRYYTKIGWLPHMIRKKGDLGSTQGHYPYWVLERLEFIEKLKSQNATNEEIAEKLNTKNKVQNLSSVFNTPEARTKAITYASFLLLLLILVSEMGIVPIGKSKTQLTPQTVSAFPKQIIDSGTSFIRSDTNKVFIKSTNVHPNSKIYISFNSNYSPAVRFWVSEKLLFEGFYIELDASTAIDAEFNWWITD